MRKRSDALRILHVVSSLSTYGAERLVAALAAAQRAEFEVAVLTMYSSAPEAAGAFGGTILDVRRRRGLHDPGFFVRMVRAIRAFRPDVVHTHVHNGKYWGRLAAIVAGVRTIVHTEHNSDFRAHPALQVANGLLHRRTARIVAFSRGHAARIARAEGLAPAKLAVIPNGIAPSPPSLSRDEARALAGAPADRALVFQVGRFQHVKNQQLAIEALAASPRLRARLQLTFVGSGVDEAAIRALAAERGVAESVTFLGYRSDVTDLLAGCDAVVMTSLNEAMPLVAIEAMIAGVPIVSVPWDGSGELFRDGAFAAISDGYAPQSLARALEETIERPEAARARAADAQAFARREYALGTCAARHGDLYKSLIAY